MSVRCCHHLIWGAMLMMLYGCASTELRDIPEPLHATGTFETALLQYVRGHEENALEQLRAYRRQRPQDQRGAILYEVIKTDTADLDEHRKMIRDDDASQPLESGSNGSDRLHVQQVLSRVESHNPRIRRRLYDIVRARAALDREGVSYGPKFDLITRFYPGGVLASLTQSAIDGIWTRNYAIEQAKGELVSRLSFYARSVRLKSYLALKKYVEILFEQKRRDLLRRRLHLARSSIRSVERRLNAYVSVERTVLEESRVVQELEERLERTNMTLRHARNKLNTLMNRPVDAPIRLTPLVAEIKDRPPIPWAVRSALARRTELSRIKGMYRRERGEIKKKKLTPLEAKGVISYGASGGGDDASVGSRALGSDLVADGRFSIPLLYWPIVKARNEEEWAILNSIESQMDEQISEIQREVGDHMETMEKEQHILDSHRQRLKLVKRERDDAKLRQENGVLPHWGYYRDRKQQYLETSLGTVTTHRTMLMTYLELTESMGVPARELPVQKLSDALSVNPTEQVEKQTSKRGIMVQYSRLMAPDFQRSFLQTYLQSMEYDRLEVRIDKPVSNRAYASLGNLIRGMHNSDGTVFARVSLLNKEMQIKGRAKRRLESVLQFQQQSPESFDGMVIEQLSPPAVDADTFLNRLQEVKKRFQKDSYPDRVQYVVPFSFIRSLEAKSRQRIRSELSGLFDERIYRYSVGARDRLTSFLERDVSGSNRSSGASNWVEIADAEVVKNSRAGDSNDAHLSPREYQDELRSMTVPFRSSPSFRGMILNDYHRMRRTVLPK